MNDDNKAVIYIDDVPITGEVITLTNVNINDPTDRKKFPAAVDGTMSLTFNIEGPPYHRFVKMFMPELYRFRLFSHILRWPYRNPFRRNLR